MKIEIKKKWVEALTSGKYEKTSQFLKCGSTFCALGVLGDIISPEWTNDQWVNPADKTIWKQTLPVSILEREFQQKIMDLNDSKRWSFKSIADWIERTIPTDEV